MKGKKSAVDWVVWLVGWSPPLFGVVAVLVLITLGTCPICRAVRHDTQLFLFNEVLTDKTVDIWKTIKELVLYLSRGVYNIQQVGATRLWTSRNEYFKTCVCWPSTNPLPPPYSDCLSMATLDFPAHPCSPYHPATNGWVKRPMEGLHHFSGKQKDYRYSGFYTDLNLDQDASLVTLNQYQEHDWLDWNTDAIVVEAVLYDSAASCIIYVQVGFERDPFRMWRSTVWAWAVCEMCWKEKEWIHSLLKVAMVLHIVPLLVHVPWSRLKNFFRSRAAFWPSKTLLLNLVVVVLYWAVVGIEHTVHHRMALVWQVPRVGKSVFPSAIATGITYLVDNFTFLLVILAMLQAAQVCARTLSELGPAVVRLVCLLAIFAVIAVPFSVTMHQLGVSVPHFSTIEDSMLAVTVAILGEIEVTDLLAATQVTGLVMYVLLFTVFKLLLFPFVALVLTDSPDQDFAPEPRAGNERSPPERRDFSDSLAALLSASPPCRSSVCYLNYHH
uniref:Polycystin domain-containing protein n=1 Tax=Scylla olivacea TaxID=85551 RepID=A0A0P4WBB2_SCYOL